MTDFHIPLIPGKSYHILSRAIGSELLFQEEENYRYFLLKMEDHLLKVCKIWAYCLIPNHFHLLVEIKDEIEIRLEFERVKVGRAFHPELVSDFIMERFSNWLNSYTKAFNKKYSRKGGLFMNYLRRVEINRDSQLSATIFYIHKNPVHHGLVQSISDWKWSSFKIHLSDEYTYLERGLVIAWFGNNAEYVEFHNQPIELKGLAEPE